MTGRLLITDGTTIVNLFNQATRGAGFFVLDWTPLTNPLKDGGTWQTSPFSQGRQLVTYEWGNTVDSFTLGVNGADQDAVIRDTQKLRRLLIKALNYWASDWQTAPVWMEARGVSESEVRYGLIKGFDAPGDSNPFDTPFGNLMDVALIEEFTLSIEHDPWGHMPPGVGECLEISGEVTATSTEIDAPTGGTDDAYTTSPASISVNIAQIFFGKGTGGQVLDLGVRFRGVAIPQGATILSAKVNFVASANFAGDPVSALIYGEDADSGAAFSSFANFYARARTSAYVPWGNVEPWATGQRYDTPDLTTIVQEIVNRAGWVSGNNLVMFVEDDNSATSALRGAAAWEHTYYREPQLTVIYQLSEPLGREATCENEVYVANKRNEANLTHIFHYDASAVTFSSNLMNATPPFDLLPAVPDVGDILYMGASDGPFPSAVFDILTAMEDVKGIVYEYYNGAWVTLTVQDNTLGDGGFPWMALGVGSMHWDQPGDWTTVLINGVTDYWVRIRVTSVDAAPVPPTQKNRLVYSIIIPYVELASGVVKGDIPARAKVTLNNQADGTNAPSGLTINVDWVLAATRSVNRGAQFTPFLNLADEQNPDGVAVTLGADTTFVTNTTTPTGRAAFYNPTGVDAMDVRAKVTLDSTLFPEYAGIFRVFARVRQSGGSAGAMNVRLRVASNNENYVIFTSATRDVQVIAPSTSNQWELIDFGSITLPNKNFSAYIFLLDAENTDATPRDLYFADLILMPVDEFAVEASEALNNVEGMLGYFDDNRKLVIDSVSNPKRLVEAELRKQSDDTVISFYVPVPENLFRIQQGARQRVYFLSWNKLTLISYVTTAYSVQMERVHQYVGMRGDE